MLRHQTPGSSFDNFKLFSYQKQVVTSDIKYFSLFRKNHIIFCTHSTFSLAFQQSSFYFSAIQNMPSTVSRYVSHAQLGH